MIRVLQFLGVMSLAGASLVGGLCIVQRSQGDTRIDNTASVVERFKQTVGHSSPQDSHEQASPLVRAAQAFALYLNPPAPAKPDGVRPVTEKENKSVAQDQLPARPEATSAKFELRGISYSRSRPDESLALIREPATGSRWVGQGAQIGHIVIERINGDSIVCKDGDRALAMNLTAKETPTALVAATKPVEKKPAPAKKATRPASGAPEPMLVRGMRQIPLARLTSDHQQDAVRRSDVTAQ
jgi:hypothetical protein